jgi:hypothetical protein
LTANLLQILTQGLYDLLVLVGSSKILRRAQRASTASALIGSARRGVRGREVQALP